MTASIYGGDTNYIRVSRKYTITFNCNFNFFYYPFNVDHCSMIYRVKRNTLNYVSLLKYGSGIIYDNNDKLVEYAVGNIDVAKFDAEEPYSGLQVTIQLQHLFASQILTIFIPTTIINLITFVTYFFKWYDFQNRVMVSLTALLVLMTLFSQVADALPKTSYFKLVDVWFFVSIVYTFLVIVSHTVVEVYHKYDHDILKECGDWGGYRPDKKGIREIEDAPARTWQEKLKDLLYRMPRAPSPRNPNSWPILLNRAAGILTSLLFVVFNLVFWSMAFMQKISAYYMDLERVQVIEEIVEYPMPMSANQQLNRRRGAPGRESRTSGSQRSTTELQHLFE
ncbi:glycine receptor subunit alpha-2-like [Penaeus chinensis]|uniref:glycine receptor subunit alpha-2-like n=1 Tax=Penaeus chinensis TaxID=139456 RepID=UPI001FB618AB|nr:glycine receptor subunit alpha-2-like [Penaeus chinensis]